MKAIRLMEQRLAEGASLLRNQLKTLSANQTTKT
jgi:hypothetical protein